MKKNFASAFLALIMVLSLAACAAPAAEPPAASPVSEQPAAEEPASEQPAAEEPASSEPVTLRLTIMGMEPQEKLLEQWIPVFEEQNPNIDVEYSVLDWGNGKTQILTSFAGGVAPDVVMAFSADIPQWVNSGALSPLEEEFASEDFINPSYELGMWQDHLYAVPLNLKLYAYYYRTDLFEAAGLDPENPPQTWDELIDASQKLTRRDANGNLEQVGFWITTSHPYKTIAQFSNFMWSAGGKFFSEDGCTPTFNSPEAVKAASLLAELLNEYKVDSPGSIQNESQDFAQAKVASLMSNNAARGIDQTSPDVVPMIRIASTPHDGTDQGYNQVGGNYLGVAANTQHRAEAIELVRFLTTTPEIVLQYSIDEFGVPALKEAVTEDYLSSDPYAARWIEIIEQTGRGMPMHPQWLEIQAIITKALDEIELQNRDPQEALDEAAEKTSAILQEYGCAGGE